MCVYNRSPLQLHVHGCTQLVGMPSMLYLIDVDLVQKVNNNMSARGSKKAVDASRGRGGPITGARRAFIMPNAAAQEIERAGQPRQSSESMRVRIGFATSAASSVVNTEMAALLSSGATTVTSPPRREIARAVENLGSNRDSTGDNAGAGKQYALDTVRYVTYVYIPR